MNFETLLIAILLIINILLLIRSKYLRNNYEYTKEDLYIFIILSAIMIVFGIFFIYELIIS